MMPEYNPNSYINKIRELNERIRQKEEDCFKQARSDYRPELAHVL